MLTDTEKRAILVRAKARAFASSVRANPGLALRVPDEIIDWLADKEVPTFFAHLRTMRVTQRDDWRWEASL